MSDDEDHDHDCAVTTTPRKDFLSVLDFDAGRSRALPASSAAQLKARPRARPRRRRPPTRSTAATSRCCSRSRRCGRARRSRSPCASSAATSIALQPDVALGRREPVADVARNLERWVDAVVIRTFSQRRARGVRRGGAAAARHQRADRRGASVPGARRLPDAAGALGHAARPDDRLRRRRQQRRDVARARGGDARRPRPRRQPGRLPAAARRRAAGDRASRGTARGCGCSPTPADAVAGADAVYTDTWTSMGQEAEADVARGRSSRRTRSTTTLMSLAKPGALFMHCLPAHRGEEVTAEVFESPASVVFDQAENRLHARRRCC